MVTIHVKSEIIDPIITKKSNISGFIILFDFNTLEINIKKIKLFISIEIIET
ncbi:MAG: hypothetical protein ACD_82C00082G0001, partial [uncultured bacterium]